MPPIFSFSYWFSVYPPKMVPFFAWGFACLFLLLLISGFVMRFLEKKALKKKDKYKASFYRKVASFGFSSAMFGGLWLFFSVEQVRVLGSRFWFLVWSILFVINMYKLYIYRFKTIPEKIKKWEIYQSKNQYMPKKD